MLYYILYSPEAYHLPDLHDVVLGHGADDPGLVWIPREVRDLGRVTAVDKLTERKHTHLFTHNVFFYECLVV